MIPTISTKHRSKNKNSGRRWTPSIAKHTIPFHPLSPANVIQLFSFSSSSEPLDLHDQRAYQVLLVLSDTYLYTFLQLLLRWCTNSAELIMNQGSSNIQSTAYSHQLPVKFGKASTFLLVVVSYK